MDGQGKERRERSPKASRRVSGRKVPTSGHVHLKLCIGLLVRRRVVPGDHGDSWHRIHYSGANKKVAVKCCQ